MQHPMPLTTRTIFCGMNDSGNEKMLFFDRVHPLASPHDRDCFCPTFIRKLSYGANQ